MKVFISRERENMTIRSGLTCFPRGIIVLLIIVFSQTPLQSQVPQGINYQALAMDGAGEPLMSKQIDVKLTILASLAPDTILWEEIHSGVMTSPGGLFTVVLGTGVRQVTSGVLLFSDIDWSVPGRFLRTGITYQSVFYNLGTSSLWSVPYSFAAGDIAGSLRKLEVTGHTDNMDEALFEVRNKSGKTVFAVYNEGVRVYVDDGLTKAVKGGFAIGSFDELKGYQEYFVVNSDCVRVYIDENPAKISKGGFAIGSFDESKKLIQDYLKVSGDSIRMYVSNNPSKASKGGFAIGTFDELKAGAGAFTVLTPENYFIGHNSGTNITTGLYNSFFGFEAGMDNSVGSNNVFLGFESGRSNQGGNNNVFLGYSSGRSNLSGQSNVFLGYLAGFSNTIGGNNVMMGDSAGYNSRSSYNVFIGRSAGRDNNNGNSNTFIGYRSGMKNISGSNNVFLGNLAGSSNTSGSENIFLGNSSGKVNTLGKDNVFMGNNAGVSNTEGCYNVFIGYFAGEKNIGTGPAGYPGNYNVFLGYSAGRYNETGQSNVYIGNLAGQKNVSGVYNTFIGRNAGGQMQGGDMNVLLGAQAAESKTGGNNNVMIGIRAGSGNGTGGSNVFIGFEAGKEETGSGLLYIENSNSSTPLIGGDFTNDRVAINGLPVSANFEVNGTFRLGTQGTNLNAIVKATVNKDLPSIPANSSYIETFAVPNASTAASVMISPAMSMTDGLVIAYARVSAPGEVTVSFRNTTSIPLDNTGMNWYITVVR